MLSAVIQDRKALAGVDGLWRYPLKGSQWARTGGVLHLSDPAHKAPRPSAQRSVPFSNTGVGPGGDLL
ncbi:hypothetical protein [Croceitalea dokdonensis]|uniref:hypothetical protein n=1 Tax=Croceitalea dokdonensis TaxID=346188 RepID=UPI0012F73A3E|nr:hypothetical protein [Croceitalea dokdonensis]